MQQLLRLTALKRCLALIAVSAALAACAGGGDASSAQSVSPQSTSGGSTSDQEGVGQATLSWTAPDENTDGTPLINLAGYRIYYGTSADALDQVVDIPSVGVTTYVVANLMTGTYYFSIRAYNSTGAESALSNIVSDTIS
jgi:hypothetical protein